MVEITSRDVTTSEQKLLYLVLQELKQINSELGSVEKAAEIKSKITACKYCGGIHENKGQALACAKKHKKEGAKNDTSD
jgi:recombinational DNA repair protein RecR